MLKKFNIRATIAISFGAIAGALCRYYFGAWLSRSVDTGYPIATLIINLSGCFLMGLVTTAIAQRLLSKPDLVLLLTTGFLGSYTTFSSYELETANLLEVKSLQIDLAYWFGSPFLGFLCFSLGSKSVEFIRPCP